MNNLPVGSQSEQAITLKHGESPLDFIRSNLRGSNIGANSTGAADVSSTAQTSQNTSTPTEVGAVIPKADNETPLQPATANTSFSDPEPTLDFSEVTPTATDDAEGESEQEGETSDSEEEDTQNEEEEGEQSGPKESIRNLRKIANETKRQLQTVQEELAESRQQLERFRNGEEVPETVAAQEQRIAELEYYEKLHNFRLSKEYRKRFTEPMEQARTRASKLAEEYALKPEVIDYALRFTNKRDLNAFLRKQFGDDVGALEARQAVEEIQRIQGEASTAEQEPAKEWDRIRDHLSERDRMETNERINNIKTVSQDAWAKALMDLRSDGRYPEFSIRENDPTHNAIVSPILKQAAAEFGRAVVMLGKDGIKALDPHAAKILAKRFLLSEAATVIAESRKAHADRAENVTKNAERTSSIIRPRLGATVQGTQAPEKRTSSPEEAAKKLSESILRKRR